MKLSIWGSGGGEGYPALFCACDNCKRAREVGGRSIRTLPQCLIDGEILIDFPADTRMHILNNGAFLDGIEHLLITHTHGDHFAPYLLELRGGVFAQNMRAEKLNIYGSDFVKRQFNNVFSFTPIKAVVKDNILFPSVTAYKEFSAGRYKITPIPANHAHEENALNYIISDGKSSLLYLVDSGYPTEEVLSFLQKRGEVFSCVTLDATMGNKSRGYYPYHMNFEEIIALKKELFDRKITDFGTRIVAMHITHNHAGTHEEIEALFQKEGIETAYDGMTVEF